MHPPASCAAHARLTLPGPHLPYAAIGVNMRSAWQQRLIRPSLKLHPVRPAGLLQLAPARGCAYICTRSGAAVRARRRVLLVHYALPSRHVRPARPPTPLQELYVQCKGEGGLLRLGYSFATGELGISIGYGC